MWSNSVQSAAFTIRFADRVIKAGFNQFVEQTGSTIFVSPTVEELLFEGYSDPLLDFIQFIPENSSLLEIIPPYDKFGWFYMVLNSICLQRFLLHQKDWIYNRMVFLTAQRLWVLRWRI